MQQFPRPQAPHVLPANRCIPLILYEGVGERFLSRHPAFWLAREQIHQEIPMHRRDIQLVKVHCANVVEFEDLLLALSGKEVSTSKERENDNPKAVQIDLVVVGLVLQHFWCYEPWGAAFSE